MVEGLKLEGRAHVSNVIVFSDCKVLIQMLNCSHDPLLEIWSMVEEINCSFHFVTREWNSLRLRHWLVMVFPPCSIRGLLCFLSG